MHPQLGSWFPYVRQVDPNQIVIQIIIMDWLMQEVAADPELMVQAELLTGWRNREVYEYIKSFDWTQHMVV